MKLSSLGASKRTKKAWVTRKKNLSLHPKEAKKVFIAGTAGLLLGAGHGYRKGYKKSFAGSQGTIDHYRSNLSYISRQHSALTRPGVFSGSKFQKDELNYIRLSTAHDSQALGRATIKQSSLARKAGKSRGAKGAIGGLVITGGTAYGAYKARQVIQKHGGVKNTFHDGVASAKGFKSKRKLERSRKEHHTARNVAIGAGAATVGLIGSPFVAPLAVTSLVAGGKALHSGYEKHSQPKRRRK